MKKHVPDVPVSREVQLSDLRACLLGHQAIGRLRNNGCCGFVGVFEELLDSAESPSDFLRQLDNMFGDLRIAGNKLAQLRRDGLGDAEGELVKALSDRRYLVEGETADQRDTVPVTVLMLDPARTLAMIDWIIDGHWMDLNGVLDGKDCGRLAKALFDSFPSLREFTAERRQQGHYEGCDLLSALRTDVTCRFPLPSEWIGLRIKHGTYNDHLEVYDCRSFAFVIQAEQSEVLSQFPRELQEQLATWQLHLPKSMTMGDKDEGFSCRHLDFGFCKESDYPEWKRLFPSLTSAGVNAGLGLVAKLRNNHIAIPSRQTFDFRLTI